MKGRPVSYQIFAEIDFRSGSSRGVSVAGVSRNDGGLRAMTSPIRRIMIVDDHDAVRRGIRNLVETKPYYQVVGEAENGRDALELARDTNPDIAILDFSLPELNGIDLAHSLK